MTRQLLNLIPAIAAAVIGMAATTAGIMGDADWLKAPGGALTVAGGVWLGVALARYGSRNSGHP